MPSVTKRRDREKAAMFSLKLSLVLGTVFGIVSSEDYAFTYNGFRSANLSLVGIAEFTSNGLLRLTNATKQQKGYAFYPSPINSFNTSSFSFFTSFVFASQSECPVLGHHDLAFVISPTRGLPGDLPSPCLGLFTDIDNGNSTNHGVAVNLETILSCQSFDINDNIFGIDINVVISKASKPASYCSVIDGLFLPLTLISGQPMQAWVDYNGVSHQMNVTLAPIDIGKPTRPLLSFSYDFSLVINQSMYVGFSSSTDSVPTSHYVLGWSFTMNGPAEALDLTLLPKLPRLGPKETSMLLTIGVPIILIISFYMAMTAVIYHVRRKRKFTEVLEDWEQNYGPHRFKYKDLYVATKGFRDKELLGTGGFGRVYRGVLPVSKMEIAIKRVSHEPGQGMKEFVAEIVSIGRMRHRNLVSLLGYCRQKGELLLVYDYMPNGSLNRYLYNQPTYTLNWNQRFRVIKGVASGLFYLHEGWEQVVIHRDVKASNVLLDGELNARLGDFGLARLYDHGIDPQTTHVVGTVGYLAPEHTRTGKATTSTDVYAFGAFMLEVACGRRPIELRAAPDEDFILVDWVYSCWNKGTVLEAADPNLGLDYGQREVELVLKLGLLCSHSEPTARPSMRQVLLYLEGALALPELLSLGISTPGLTFANREGLSDFAMSYPSSMEKPFSHSSSVAESLLSGGR